MISLISKFWPLKHIHIALFVHYLTNSLVDVQFDGHHSNSLKSASNLGVFLNSRVVPHSIGSPSQALFYSDKSIGYDLLIISYYRLSCFSI